MVLWWIARLIGCQLVAGCRLISASRLELFSGTCHSFLAHLGYKLWLATCRCSLSTVIIVESLSHLGYFTWMSSHPDKIINTHLTRLLSYQNCQIFAFNVGLLSGQCCRRICTNLDRLKWMRSSDRHRRRLSGLILRITYKCFMGIIF